MANDIQLVGRSDIYLLWHKPEEKLPDQGQKVLVIVKESAYQRRTMDIGYFRNVDGVSLFVCSNMMSSMKSDQIECWISVEEYMR